MANALPKPAPLAPLPGEQTLLAGVVANLADDDAKLVYADWLEDHDDPRGLYLRTFVEAFRSGHALPERQGPPDWQEMLGLNLLRCLDALQARQHREIFLALAKPVVGFATQTASERSIPRGATKFGGRPDLPRGSEWPRCERGPLEFLLQLNLPEMHSTLAGMALPPEGLLSFFMYHDYDNDEYGNGRGEPLDYNDGICILHTTNTGGLVRLAPPDDLVDELGPPKQPCRVSIREWLELPSNGPLWQERYGPAYDIVFDVLRNWERPPRHGGHKLFGYSHAAHIGKDPIPGPEWQQLLSLYSDNILLWGWGDGHELFWFIRTSDLEAGRFTDTRAIDG